MLPTLVPARSAVLSMDYQSGIVLKHLRSPGMPVIHVAVGFRPGLPEISPRNLLLGAIKSSAQHQQLFQGAAGAIHSSVAPEGDDVVITKHRVSAFAGTDLDPELHACLVERVFPRQATVVSASELLGLTV